MESGSDGESQERSELDVNEKVRERKKNNGKNEVEEKKTEKQFNISVKKEKIIMRVKFRKARIQRRVTPRTRHMRKRGNWILEKMNNKRTV